MILIHPSSLGKIMTDAQLTERDGNIKTSLSEDAKKEAIKIAKDEFKKRGLEVTGERWGDIVNEVNDKINKDKDSKIGELQKQNTDLIADNTKYKTEAEQAAQKVGAVEFEFNVMSSLPKNELGLSPKESLALMKMRGYEPAPVDGGGVVWKKNGEVIKDGTTHSPLPADKAVGTIWGELKWNVPAAATGGRNITSTGAGASGGIANMADAKAAFAKQHPGKSLMSPEFQQFVEVAAKENTAFSYAPTAE